MPKKLDNSGSFDLYLHCCDSTTERKLFRMSATPVKPAPAPAPVTKAAPAGTTITITAPAPAPVTSLSGWVLTPATAIPAEVKGATPELRQVAKQLVAASPNGLRHPSAGVSSDDVEIIRKLLRQDGFRLKVRESLFGAQDGSNTLVLCKVLTAVARREQNAAA